MASRRSTNSVSLFPFLAVLICAMGALIFLLLVTTRRIRSDAIARAAEASNPPAEVARMPPELPTVEPQSLTRDRRPDRPEEWPDWLNDPAFQFDVAQSEPETSEAAIPAPQLAATFDLEPPRPDPEPPADPPLPKLEAPILAEPTYEPVPVPQPRPIIDKRKPVEDRIAALEREHEKTRLALAEAQRKARQQRTGLEQLEAQVAQGTVAQLQLERESKSLEATEAQLAFQQRQTKVALQQIEQQILVASERQAAFSSTKFSILPYDGRTGTARRPILIECTEQGLRFIPEDVVVRDTDLKGFIPSYNPLLAGARELTRYWKVVDQLEAGPTDRDPYVLLIVRPTGSLAFYAAQAMLKGLEAPFGYELLNANIELDLPQPDTNAQTACREAVESVIAERESVLASLPSRGSGYDSSFTRAEPAESNTRQLRFGADGQIRVEGPSRDATPGTGFGRRAPSTNDFASRSPRGPFGDTITANPQSSSDRPLREPWSTTRSSRSSANVSQMPRDPGSGFRPAEPRRSLFTQSSRPFESIMSPALARSNANAASSQLSEWQAGKLQNETAGQVSSVPNSSNPQLENRSVAGDRGEPFAAVGTTPAENGFESPVPSNGPTDATNDDTTEQQGAAPGIGGSVWKSGRPTAPPNAESTARSVGSQSPANRSASQPFAANAGTSNRGTSSQSPNGTTQQNGGPPGPESTEPSSTTSPSTSGQRPMVPQPAPAFTMGRKRRWGLSPLSGVIGFEREITLHVDRDRIVIARRFQIPIDATSTKRDVISQLTNRLDEHAKSWGRPPHGYYWVPVLRMVTGSEGQIVVNAIQDEIRKHDLSLTVETMSQPKVAPNLEASR